MRTQNAVVMGVVCLALVAAGSDVAISDSGSTGVGGGDE
jgi:hypothetical protein